MASARDVISIYLSLITQTLGKGPILTEVQGTFGKISDREPGHLTP